jgi:hypothetical protein
MFPNIDTAPESTANSYTAVADRAARLAITTAQIGDIVKDNSTNTYYILTALPAATQTNWQNIVIVNATISTTTPTAGSATIDYIAQNTVTQILNCTAEVAAVTINPSMQGFYAHILIVKIGAVAINLNFVGTWKQAGGGGSTVTTTANSTYIITMFTDSTDYYLSPQLYA